MRHETTRIPGVARRLLHLDANGVTAALKRTQSAPGTPPQAASNLRICEPANHRTVKLIIAYIQPERLNAVKQALFAREIYKMSVTNALGCGQQGGYVHMYRGATEEVTLHKKMRLAIGVNDDFIEKTIEAIVEGARTGDIGDGKIFVLPMDECVRIRTGERGPAAIG
jgi:nitrogen regulatory protein P-II 1